jgi:SAM-dependent methyltransferase
LAGKTIEKMIPWEQAVEQLRRDPAQAELVLACYYDDPLRGAAERFAASEEWVALQSWLPSRGRVLDLGAGRGISSYAFAKTGWEVIALEPDPSEVVGAGAIRSLSREAGLAIEVVESWGETLPFAEASFDLVYGRAVFHHARDLEAFCNEAFRVLRPGGRLILTREHVLSSEADLDRFLAQHPLHRLYGGEAAYTLDRYLEAVRAAGFAAVRTVGPKSSPVNYFPESSAAVDAALRERRAKRIGAIRAFIRGWSMSNREEEAALWESKMKVPGRLYSFIAERRAES